MKGFILFKVFENGSDASEKMNKLLSPLLNDNNSFYSCIGYNLLSIKKIPAMKCWISCVIILFVSIQTSHSQKYNIEKKPNWVAPIDLPGNSLVSKYGISTGFYLTLADYQVNLEEDAVYNHEVINVVSYSGITKSCRPVGNHV